MPGQVGAPAESACTEAVRRGIPAEASRTSARIRSLADDLNKCGRQHVHEVVVLGLTESRLGEKEAMLVRHLDEMLVKHKDNRALVFVRNSSLADHLAARLRHDGGPLAGSASAFHGGKMQESRFWTVDMFKKGDLRVMVAPDVVIKKLPKNIEFLTLRVPPPAHPETTPRRFEVSN